MLQLQEKKIDDIAELVGRIDAGLRAVVGGSEPTMTRIFVSRTRRKARCLRS